MSTDTITKRAEWILEKYPFLHSHLDLNPHPENPGAERIGLEGVRQLPGVKLISLGLLMRESRRRTDWDSAFTCRFLLFGPTGELLTEVRSNYLLPRYFNWRRPFDFLYRYERDGQRVKDAARYIRGDFGYVLELRPVDGTFILYKLPGEQSYSERIGELVETEMLAPFRGDS